MVWYLGFSLGDDAAATADGGGFCCGGLPSLAVVIKFGEIGLVVVALVVEGLE